MVKDSGAITSAYHFGLKWGYFSIGTNWTSLSSEDRTNSKMTVFVNCVHESVDTVVTQYVSKMTGVNSKMT